MMTLKMFIFPELSQWGTVNPQNKTDYYLLEVVAYLSGGILAGSLLVGLRWLKLDQLQRINTLCSLPVIGKCYQLFYGYYVVTNLAMMIRHGLTIKEICAIVSEGAEQSFLSILGNLTKNAVNQGHGLTEPFKRARFLPGELKIIVAKGSTLSDLGSDLTALANILFTRLTRRIERLLALIQPIIFSIIALIIIGLYLRLLLPIYHSVQGVI